MAKRPLLHKQAARYRKALRATPPVNMDLVEWLISRRHAQTAGDARKLLTDGLVRVESHAVGRQRLPVMVKGKVEEQWVATPVVPTELRDRLTVVK